ncbi:MAG TPA: ABC transporter permease [Gaiellaceae bacterium]|nr:ABC transporter permease [Gaiellaceae bacterium]
MSESRSHWAGTVTAPASSELAREVVIAPTRGWPALRLDEISAYRELLYFLVWRDVKVRYKQTALGVAWAVLQPLLTVFVFTVFFNRVGGITVKGVPYVLFSLSGMIPWLFFANGVTIASASVVTNVNLVTKVYFPRLVIPIASVLSNLPDVAIGLGLLLVVMAAYGTAPAVAILAVPLILVLVFASALAVSLWLSALSVEFRDVRYVVPLLVQLWLLASPVAYSISKIGGTWKTVLALNPMTGSLGLFRWAMLGLNAPPASTIAVSCAVTIVTLVGGAYYFRAMERKFADIA